MPLWIGNIDEMASLTILGSIVRKTLKARLQAYSFNAPASEALPVH